MLQRAFLPVTTGNVFAAHQNLAIVREMKFAARQNFSDGTCSRAKRMIEADERGGLRHAVALHHRVAEALEEILRFRGKRGSAGNEGPEFPAETPMNAAEHPGAAKKFLGLGGSESAREPFEFAARFEIALDAFAQ